MTKREQIERAIELLSAYDGTGLAMTDPNCIDAFCVAVRTLKAVIETCEMNLEREKACIAISRESLEMAGASMYLGLILAIAKGESNA